MNIQKSTSKGRNNMKALFDGRAVGFIAAIILSIALFYIYSFTPWYSKFPFGFIYILLLTLVLTLPLAYYGQKRKKDDEANLMKDD